MIKTTATMTSIDGDRDPLFAGGQAKRGCSGRCGDITNISNSSNRKLYI